MDPANQVGQVFGLVVDRNDHRNLRVRPRGGKRPHRRGCLSFGWCRLRTALLMGFEVIEKAAASRVQIWAVPRMVGFKARILADGCHEAMVQSLLRYAPTGQNGPDRTITVQEAVSRR